ncbi:endoplasmic reticulum Oxidoreductin 1-domain-containing protein [Geopyxis carbonaria]|nr:endoplasmic reticulum Oxidoreductin 1-domain-containing protein [Geopyxis carbonaria]
MRLLTPSPAVVLLVLSGAIASGSSICSNGPDQIVPDGCVSYGALEELNQNIRPLVHDVTKATDFFSYYRLDLYGRTCPFWSDDAGMCANIACAVNTIDDEESIPLIWRATELGKLTGPKASHPKGEKAAEPSPLDGALGEGTEESCIVEEDECDDRDYCVPEDESIGSQGDYVSLVENPERFTGYAGAGAENVWKSIYRENCFLKPQAELKHPYSQGDSVGRSQAAQGFLNVLQDKGKHEIEIDEAGNPTLSGVEVDDECLEKRVFYRVISGMHSSISMHLCWDYLNQSNGEWGPNLDCFIKRFEGHTERLQNIYFNYAILVRAISKLRNYIPLYTFCSGDNQQNRLTKAKLIKLAQSLPEGTQIFDESVMFQDDMAILKEDFRNRFRNVSRVMDCVGCDKCRLWGKVQTQGYGTALKILFDFDENATMADNPPLRRTELVALLNTLDRLSHSLEALQGFQRLWEERNITSAAESNHSADVPREHSSQKKENDGGVSFSEQFWAEWNLVWSTFWFVLKSWYYLPGALWNAGISELSIKWDDWVGRAPSHSVRAKSEL